MVTTIATGLDAVAAYTCDQGYDLGGDATRSCQANSQWNGAEPICTCKSCNPSHFVDYQLYLQMGFYYLLTVIDCGNLRNPENGLVAITPGVVAETGVGALATYTCSEGYELIGNGVRTCQDSGDWNQVAPSCMCKYP